MRRTRRLETDDEPAFALSWIKAPYSFHTYAYRDPRSAFASGSGLPVVSPTTVILGLVATLYRLGQAELAQRLLDVAHFCEVVIDAPRGVIFFRAFHQLRRYETLKYGPNPRFGLTKINQGTREYGLVDGEMTVFVGVPEDMADAAMDAMTNITHFGTHDSLCSLVLAPSLCDKPDIQEVLYAPATEYATYIQAAGAGQLAPSATLLSLSRFRSRLKQPLRYWKMAGDSDTEIVLYAIPGSFQGTARGKIYRKSRG